MQEILIKAFRGLYPKRQIPQLRIRFSGRFQSYNANVQIKKQLRRITELEFRMSKAFEKIDEVILIGVAQHLLNKVYKTKIQTLEQEVYANFLKHAKKYSAKNIIDTELKTVFDTLNERYFSGLMAMPNLKFGREALRTLGHYNYNTDTITISPVLLQREDLLEFVMYHEMLHKKHGITKTKTGRNYYHTTAFRRDEKKFHIPDIEKKLEGFLRKKKMAKAFSWF